MGEAYGQGGRLVKTLARAMLQVSHNRSRVAC